MSALLGGKGANLAEMCHVGVPVPAGFTLPTELCRAFLARSPGELTDEEKEGIAAGLAHIESEMPPARFGDSERPLLVSVRSGGRVSMPGMMDTVLNLGLNRETLVGLAAWSGDRRFALDAYRRLLQMFGDVVRGIARERLEAPLVRLKADRGVRFDHELDEADLERLVDELESVHVERAGSAFPADPYEQLHQAVAAVFRSWNGKRARTYRSLNGIPDDWGTAANVQAMVFGNLGSSSATGVAFSRNPATGESRAMGEWLPNAQGEDVVAGIRTPGPLHRDGETKGGVASLEEAMPAVYAELIEKLDLLEKHFSDMQDVEFTVQESKLWILQTRTGKRTALAALRTAVEMSDEGLIDHREAVRRLTPEQADQLLHPQIDPEAPRELLARGLPASPGAATGLIVLDSAEAARRGAAGEAVILVRGETSPEDIHGMSAARGVLTRTGGMTSHAAVVARGMGRTCVVGCEALEVDEERGEVRVRTEEGVEVLAAGEEITVDGTSGDVYRGAVATVEAKVGGHFARLMGWADEMRRLGVRANADTPDDARRAIELGAEGIGLCRTEHMFFGRRRLLAVREMILATSAADRRRALGTIEPVQRQDFVAILLAMEGRPVTIRLLDPPLHEFLPEEEEELAEIAAHVDLPVDEVRRRRDALREENPMLGHRGCRLGLSFPEIYETQVRAIYDAACDVLEKGHEAHPEVMVPLVMEPEELRRVRAAVVAAARDRLRARGVDLPIVVGTMIELPRAALVADRIAEFADFFSFGTNDLTQTAMGLSRDDSGRFLPRYVADGILPADPFRTLDEAGVGRLIEMGCSLGRGASDDLKLGVCGEQGGDPQSIRFFHAVGVDYVSCSPFRVPVARLAAAHAALEDDSLGR